MDEEDYNYDDYNNEEPNDVEEEHDQDVPGPIEHPSYSNEEPIGEEQDYEILPLVKLFTELNLILEQVHNLVYLDKGWCLILLKDFKWDHEILRQQYYNQNEFYLKRAGFKPGLNHPACFDQGVTGMCEVCCNEDVPLYYNICDHNFCIDCWMYHLKNCIQGGSAFPRCMNSDCPHPILLETMVRVFSAYGEEGEHWMKKFQKKLCELFITTNRNYQFCTGVDCGNCIKVNTQLDTVVCNCGKIFCFRCQSDDHYPCKCQEKGKWIEQVVKEEADAKWISQNAKICPWCKKAVERSMGCNFMACTCGKSFCYMCSQPWEPDHKDHFKCHIFKKKPDDIINREKEVMERMNHCTERYIFNQAVANNYKEIDVFSKRKYLFKALHIDLTDSEFMENAYKFAIECCEKLKWIYAFTYFHDLKYRKDSFEFSLGEYERYKENLLKLLAADLKKFVNNVEEMSKEGPMDQSVIELMTTQFKNLKKQIVNYYTCTKNFKEKFVEELEHITEEMDAEKDKEEMQSYYKENPNLLLKTSKSKEDMGEKQEKKGILNTIFGGNKKGKKKK